MSVTLKDVAQAARVSVSTASRALTGTGLTSERTQQRLVRIARELGYRPNPIARGLKTGQSRLVALLVHNLTNASFQVMAEVVQARLKALGYQMLLCIGGDDPQQESDTLTTLVDHRIDGLIVVPTGKNGAQLKTLAKDVPIVCLVRRDDATDLETVLADDPQGAYLGTRHLIELGHKRIGLIVGRQDTTSGRERLSGYVRALREAGIAKDDTLIHAVTLAMAALSRATAIGETDRVVKPVASSAFVKRVSAAASPQSETSTPRLRPASTVRAISASTAGWPASLRSATAPISRAAAIVYWVRSFDPME